MPMHLPIACLLFLAFPAPLPAQPAAPLPAPAVSGLPAPAAAAPTTANWFFEPSPNDLSERAAMLMQQPQVEVMPEAILSPSGYGTYVYAKVGTGAAMTESFDFGNVPLERFGIRDIVQDIVFQGQVLEDIVFRDIVNETTTLQFDTPAGPLLAAGLGLDISIGREFLGNRLRPRVEAEYTYHPVRISRPRGAVTFREAERDEFGGIIVIPTQPPQSVLGEPVTEVIGFRSGDMELHTLSSNFILTYEVFDRVRPYLGAGAGITYASANIAGLADTDWTLQLQGLGGVIFSITEDFELDVGLRYSTVEVDVFNSSADINSLSATLMLNIRL